MKTLSTAWRTFFRTGTRPTFYAIIRSGASGWMIGGSLKYYYVFSDGPLAWGGSFATIDTTRMGNGSIDNVTFKVDERELGGMAAVGDFTFRVHNDGNFKSGLEAAGVFFENHDCWLKLSHPGSTTDYGTDDLLLFAGIIKEVQIEGEYLVFRVETKDEAWNRKVPPRTFEPEDAEWATLQIAKPVRGKAVPLIFGDHDMAEAYTISDVYDDGAADRGRMIQFADVNWGATGIRIGSVEDIRYGDGGLVEATGGFAIINGASGKSVYTVTTNKDKAYFETVNPTSLYLKLDIFPRSWIIRETGLSTGADHRNALDDDLTNYAYQSGATTNDSKWMSYKVPEIGLSGTVEGSDSSPGYYAIMHVDPDDDPWLSDGGGTYWHGWAFFLTKFKAQGPMGSNVPCYYKRAFWESPVVVRNNYSTPANWEDFQLQEFNPVTWGDYDGLDDLSQCYIGVGVRNNGIATDSPGIRLHGLGLRVHCYIDWPSEGFYAHATGYIDNTSGTITGTAGTLIENPAAIVAFMWSYLSNATTTDVDISGMRQVAAERAGWAFAQQLTEQQTDLTSVIGEICEQALLWCWVNPSGLIKLFSMTAPAPTSVRDILEAEVSEGRLGRRELSPSEDVASKFVFRFKYNPVRGGYENSLFCNADDCSVGLDASLKDLCASARDDYLGERDKDLAIELPWVRDRDTALLVATAIVQARTKRRWILEWEEDLPGVQYDLGDPVRLSPLAWAAEPPAIRAGTFRIVQQQINPSTFRVVHRAIEVV